MENISVTKVMTTIILVASLITGILALDGRYATSKDLAKMEQQTIQTIEELRKNIALQSLEDRYIRLNDQLMAIKIQQRKYPNDQELKDDYNATLRERDKVKEELDRTRVR
jgi:hypothetical protein